MSDMEEFNGVRCCLLQLCCSPLEQQTAIMKAARKSIGRNVSADDAVKWITETFTLVPKDAGNLLKVGYDMGVAHEKKAKA